MRFDKTMLRSLRVARSVRVILGVAAAIAIGSSFGLHAEPGGFQTSDAVAKPAVSTKFVGHGCAACLSHGATTLAPAAAAALTSAPRCEIPRSSRFAPAGRLAARAASDRAPPFRS